VRGLADVGGSLTGTADYDVFGQVRATSGASSVFGFTGQQFDRETGFTFLRARYLDPRLSRFLSADSVQPNAPGTQGYNPYAYVANNPTTWVDPSGHMAWAAAAAVASSSWITVPIVFAILYAAPMLICAMDPGCSAEWWEYNKIIEHYGSEAWEGAQNWTRDRLRDAAGGFPPIPGFDSCAEAEFLGCMAECLCSGNDRRYQVACWALRGAYGVLCGAICADCLVPNPTGLAGCVGCAGCLGVAVEDLGNCAVECLEER